MVNIPIAYQQRFVPQKPKRPAKTSPSAEDDLFLLDNDSVNPMQGGDDLLPQMVAIHHDMVKPQILQAFDGEKKQRLVENRKKRFGANQRVWQQPGAEARRQYHCLHALSFNS